MAGVRWRRKDSLPLAPGRRSRLSSWRIGSEEPQTATSGSHLPNNTSARQSGSRRRPRAQQAPQLPSGLSSSAPSSVFSTSRDAAPDALASGLGDFEDASLLSWAYEDDYDRQASATVQRIYASINEALYLDSPTTTKQPPTAPGRRPASRRNLAADTENQLSPALRAECEEWSSCFPHLRLLGAAPQPAGASGVSVLCPHSVLDESAVAEPISGQHDSQGAGQDDLLDLDLAVAGHSIPVHRTKPPSTSEHTQLVVCMHSRHNSSLCTAKVHFADEDCEHSRHSGRFLLNADDKAAMQTWQASRLDEEIFAAHGKVEEIIAIDHPEPQPTPQSLTPASSAPHPLPADILPSPGECFPLDAVLSQLFDELWAHVCPKFEVLSENLAGLFERKSGSLGANDSQILVLDDTPPLAQAYEQDRATTTDERRQHYLQSLSRIDLGINQRLARNGTASFIAHIPKPHPLSSRPRTTGPRQEMEAAAADVSMLRADNRGLAKAITIGPAPIQNRSKTMPVHPLTQSSLRHADPLGADLPLAAMSARGFAGQQRLYNPANNYINVDSSRHFQARRHAGRRTSIGQALPAAGQGNPPPSRDRRRDLELMGRRLSNQGLPSTPPANSSAGSKSVVRLPPIAGAMSSPRTLQHHPSGHFAALPMHHQFAAVPAHQPPDFEYPPQTDQHQLRLGSSSARRLRSSKGRNRATTVDSLALSPFANSARPRGRKLSSDSLLK